MMAVRNLEVRLYLTRLSALYPMTEMAIHVSPRGDSLPIDQVAVLLLILSWDISG